MKPDPVSRADRNATPVPPCPRWLRPTVDYGPLGVFFVAYCVFDIVSATAAMLIATIAVLGLSMALNHRVPATTLITSSMLLVFGGLTLLFNDPSYLKLQSTLISLLFSLILFAALAFGWPLVRMMFGATWPMSDAGWRTLTLRFALFFAGMAGLNEIVSRTQSTDIWVDYNVFGQTGLAVAFLVAQWPLVNRHLQKVPADKTQDEPRR
jgi:intracellular septation protein